MPSTEVDGDWGVIAWPLISKEPTVTLPGGAHALLEALGLPWLGLPIVVADVRRHLTARLHQDKIVSQHGPGVRRGH